MARAHSIWTVIHRGEVVRVFTVKHECASWLERYETVGHLDEYYMYFDDLEIRRYADGQRDLKEIEMTDYGSARDFLKSEGYVDNLVD